MRSASPFCADPPVLELKLQAASSVQTRQCVALGGTPLPGGLSARVMFGKRLAGQHELYSCNSREGRTEYYALARPEVDSRRLPLYDGTDRPHTPMAKTAATR
jgi:hypothetical protein